MDEELKMMLGKLADRIDGLQTEMRAEFRSLGERMARIEGRMEEQSRTVTALIPTTVAAVPPRPPTPSVNG